MILNAYDFKKKVNTELRVIDVYVDGDAAKYRIEEQEPDGWDKDRRNNFIIYVNNARAWASEKHAGWNFHREGKEKSVAAAMRTIKDLYEKSGENLRKKSAERARVPVAALPAGPSDDFFPTPSALAGKMLGMVDFRNVRAILEPSAGKGDLVEAACNMLKNKCGRGHHTNPYELQDGRAKSAFDVVEIDPNLRLMLRGMGLRLVGDDFLQYRPQKRYDLVLMNPPFSCGAAHLLHAIQIMENGGQIVCLLNAETIRNPYTNERKLLKKKLAEYAARIEFVSGAFQKAQRKSDVEIAIVYLNIPAVRAHSDIFERAQKAAKVDFEEAQNEPRALVLADEIQALIQGFNAEARAGIELMRQYDAVAPYIMSGSGEYDKPIIKLSIKDSSYSSINNAVVNEYLRLLRGKYWHLLLEKPSVRDRMTSAMQDEYSSKLRDMQEYDFNEHNVMMVYYDIMLQLQQGVEDSILSLFDELSGKYSWSREINNDNVHYYNGWATNKAWKVGKKVILPIQGFHTYYTWKPDELDENDVAKKIADLERCMTFLDKGETEWSCDPYHVIRMANQLNTTRQKLHFTYFTAKFYKKGTCHIQFRDEAQKILDRLNIFAARNRGWLPPRYGKASYKDMTPEEKAVIDDFQGEAAYTELMRDPSNMIMDASSLTPMLSA